MKEPIVVLAISTKNVYNKTIKTVMIPGEIGQKTTQQRISPDGGIFYG